MFGYQFTFICLLMVPCEIVMRHQKLVYQLKGLTVIRGTQRRLVFRYVSYQYGFLNHSLGFHVVSFVEYCLSYGLVSIISL